MSEPDDSQVGRLVPSEWLGRALRVVVDRPVGSLHPTSGLRYQVDYGYVPGFVAPDGEELDAYVLGPLEPLDAFEGRVVAVIVRLDDREDKRVVADADTWEPQALAAAVVFQERFFRSLVITRREC